MKVSFWILLGVFVFLGCFVFFNIKVNIVIKTEKNINEQLINSVRSGDLDSVKVCLKNGGNINYRDKFKSTPLFYAVTNGNLSIANFLLNNKAEVNLLYKNDYNLLHVAVEYYNTFHFSTDFIELLLNAGVQINQQDKYGNTPLWHACINYLKHIDAVKILVKSGADFDIKNKYGSSVYSFAKENNFKDLILLLDAQRESSVKTHKPGQ
jgi:uncharacterized protein